MWDSVGSIGASRISLIVFRMDMISMHGDHLIGELVVLVELLK